MEPTPLRRLVVELEPGEPIAGWVEGETEPRQRFDGLLELVATLERARAAAADVTEEEPPG